MSKSAGVRKAGARSVLDPGHLLVRRVLDFIRERGLEPGERLPAERVLAERLGVSRNALREALASLTSLRAVEARPHSGIYVKSLGLESSFETTVLLSEAGAAPTATEVAESMEVRLPLERQAISLACARRTAADLAALKRILDDTDRIVATGGNIIDCDQAFHLALAGGRFLAHIRARSMRAALHRCVGSVRLGSHWPPAAAPST